MMGSPLSGQLAAIVNNGRNTPPMNVTSARTLTAADAGNDFTNTGAVADIVLPVTPGLSLGTTFEISQTVLFNFGLSFSGGESVKIGTAAPASTITAISNGGTTTGSTFLVRKETDTLYFLKYFQGSVG